MVVFFVLEKLVIWRHCHDGECAVHGAAAPLILIGDTLHNFADGVVIAAAFLVGTSLGIATTVAVIAHELPQELGDFAILLDSGYSRARALALNALSGLASLAGALLAYGALEAIRDALPYVLALSAASFLYIATADLIPGLHRRPGAAEGLSQVLLLLAGIAPWSSSRGCRIEWHPGCTRPCKARHTGKGGGGEDPDDPGSPRWLAPRGGGSDPRDGTGGVLRRAAVPAPRGPGAYPARRRSDRSRGEGRP
jgi:hypothetical protein